jgi:hypothetical protein
MPGSAPTCSLVPLVLKMVMPRCIVITLFTEARNFPFGVRFDYGIVLTVGDWSLVEVFEVVLNRAKGCRGEETLEE